MNIQDINREYIDIKDSYSDFLKETTRIIEKLLNREKIPIAFNISERLKDVKSIEEKHNSKRFILKKTITEYNDLVGIRIILLYPDFKDKVIELFKSEFKIIDSYESKPKGIDQFGYKSIHLIIGIKDEWAVAPDWKDHQSKKIEIQIRTVAEHIWAEISHSLFYKRNENIPDVAIIKRDLHRLSALLEVVDEKLDSIKKGFEDYVKKVDGLPYEDILEMDLNPETFKRIMKKRSNDVYNLDDIQNKLLSSRIESEYNILTSKVLDSVITLANINTENITNENFIAQVLNILDSRKKEIDDGKY